MVSYEYVLGGVLASLLASVFIMIINSARKVEGVRNRGNGLVGLSQNGEEKATDVVIVGAGVAGAALAYTLAKVRF